MKRLTTVSALLLWALPGEGAERKVASLDVVGARFEVRLTDGSLLPDAQLAGAVLALSVEGKPDLSVRIDSIETDPVSPELTLYGVSFRDPATGEWKSLCQPNKHGDRRGFPMRGTLAADVEYRPDAPGYSFACLGGVQAKCVRWGYHPWKPDRGGVHMLDLYRTCMRMARADYCGLGEGTTRNGMPIDFYDVAGIQEPEAESVMPFEAAWGPKGAICVRHTRVPQNLSLDELGKSCPRLAAYLGETCDQSAKGALMFNRSMGDGVPE